MFRRAENLLCLSLSCTPFPSLRMNSKKMKVLVLGHTGTLGHMVQGTLSKDPTIDVHTMLFDAADLEPLRFFENDTFDYCINCIGITARHIDEGDSVSVQRAITVNSLFPHRLARYAQEHGVKVVHMSTDGVFSGMGGPYREGSPQDCGDVYGKTKSLGEVRADNVITIRCSIIGPSPKKEGLLEWFF